MLFENVCDSMVRFLCWFDDCILIVEFCVLQLHEKSENDQVTKTQSCDEKQNFKFLFLFKFATE